MKPIQHAYIHGAAQAVRDFEKHAGVAQTLDNVPSAVRHALAGGAIGGGTGALLAGEDDRGKGALIGALLGGAGGAARVDDLASALGWMGEVGGPRSTATTGMAGLLGGGAGGVVGRAFKKDREINESGIRGLLRKSGAAKLAAGLGDPMFWQGGQEAAMAQEGGGGGGTAEEAAMALPPGIFQGLQMKVNPAGERSTTVKATPEALSTPETLAGIFEAEPGVKVELSAQTQGGEGGAGEQGDVMPQGTPVDGAGAAPPPMGQGIPEPPMPGKVAELIRVAEKTRIEIESDPREKIPRTKAERDAAKIKRMNALIA
jgi:hypothetical protein